MSYILNSCKGRAGTYYGIQKQGIDNIIGYSSMVSFLLYERISYGELYYFIGGGKNGEYQKEGFGHYAQRNELRV